MRSSVLFYLLFSAFPAVSQFNPLDIKLIVSGAFGEPRDNHFHTGIDFTTGGKTGVKIFAFNDGYVSRVKVSSVGYGKALYITHPDGTMSVYGHLESFNDAIAQYVTDEQYRLKKNEVELYPQRDQLPISKGSFVAYSGNTGGSSGPHLHFEIRDAQGESFPLNPLAYNLAMTDSFPPTLHSIVFYDRSGLAERQLNEYMLHKKGRAYTAGIDTFLINSNEIGVGLRTDDKIGAGSLNVGVYSVEFWVDNTLFHAFSLDRLDFSEGRCANAHIDYKKRKANKQRAYRLYRLPGNTASIYKTNNASLKVEPGKVYHLRIVVSDFHKNTAEYKFHLRTNSTGGTKLTPPSNYITYNKPFSINEEKLKVHLDAGSVYDNFLFYWKQVAPCGNNISSSYNIGDTFVAVHKPYTISIKPERTLPGVAKEKYIIARGSTAYSTDWSGEWLTAKVKEFGTFKAVLDTTAPRVSPINFSHRGKSPSNLKMKMHDNLAGIKYYDVYIDDQWTLAEYDAKNDLLTVRPRQKIASGERQVKIVVSDKVNNKRTYTYSVLF